MAAFKLPQNAITRIVYQVHVLRTQIEETLNCFFYGTHYLLVLIDQCSIASKQTGKKGSNLVQKNGEIFEETKTTKLQTVVWIDVLFAGNTSRKTFDGV